MKINLFIMKINLLLFLIMFSFSGFSQIRNSVIKHQKKVQLKKVTESTSNYDEVLMIARNGTVKKVNRFDLLLLPAPQTLSSFNETTGTSLTISQGNTTTIPHVYGLQESVRFKAPNPHYLRSNNRIVPTSLGDGAVDLAWFSTVSKEGSSLGDFSFSCGFENFSNGSYSFTSNSLNRANGDYSHSSGARNVAHSYGEFAAGVFSTDYTASSISGFFDTDRLFNVGNGLSDTSRSDALTILKNGRILAPSLDISEINEDKSLITKEYLDFQMSGGSSDIINSSGTIIINDITASGFSEIIVPSLGVGKGIIVDDYFVKATLNSAYSVGFFQSFKIKIGNLDVGTVPFVNTVGTSAVSISRGNDIQLDSGSGGFLNTALTLENGSHVTGGSITVEYRVRYREIEFSF